MFTIITDKICSLVITGLADVDGFKWYIQCVVGHASPPHIVNNKEVMML